MTDLSNCCRSAPASVSQAPTFVPPTDIFGDKDAIIMLLEMLGADPESLNVTLDKGVLSRFGSLDTVFPLGYTLAYAEYRDGNYERSFTLPQQVDSANALRRC